MSHIKRITDIQNSCFTVHYATILSLYQAIIRSRLTVAEFWCSLPSCEKCLCLLPTSTA